MLNQALFGKITPPVSTSPSPSLKHDAVIDFGDARPSLILVHYLQSQIEHAPRSKREQLNTNQLLYSINRDLRLKQNILLIAAAYLRRENVRMDLKTIAPEALERNRLLVTMLFIAHKYLEDHQYQMHDWHDVSGVSKQKLHRAEVYLLNALDHNLHVSHNEFHAVKQDYLAYRKRFRAHTI